MARSTLTHDQVITWTKAKVRVFSDSASCVEVVRSFRSKSKMAGPEADFQLSASDEDVLGIGEETSEFERCILTGFTSLQIVQKDLQDRNIEPEKFEDRVIFMSMFNDIGWTGRNSEKCISNAFQIPKKKKTENCAKKFSRGYWTFLGSGDEKKWCGTLSYTPEGKWDSIASQMVERFKETGHPVFKSIGASESWNSEKKKKRISDTPHTSMPMLRRQNSYFAQFAQQISSVSKAE